MQQKRHNTLFCSIRVPLFGSALVGLLRASAARASEAELVIPDLGAVAFLGVSGRTLLFGGIAVCLLGLAFGLVIYRQLQALPVHRSMREISELIYETCKTYLLTQGKFILLLWAFIAVIMVAYFGWLRHFSMPRVLLIIFFSLVGIGGSSGVAWFRIRTQTFASSRTASASVAPHALPAYS